MHLSLETFLTMNAGDMIQQVKNWLSANENDTQSDLLLIKVQKKECLNSQIIETRFRSLKERFNKNSIHFIYWDIEKPLNLSCQLPSKINVQITDFLPKQVESGTLLLIDPKKGLILETLTRPMFFSEMVARIDQYLPAKHK